MNIPIDTNSIGSGFRRQVERTSVPLLALLAVALTAPGRAETPPAIPFSDIGARATAGYQGDALGITVTADGARLRCGFQKLEGHATAEGLWLESTKPGAPGKLRLSATALGRNSSARPPALADPGISQPSAPTDVAACSALAATGSVSVQDKLVRFERPGLTEEYSVSVAGVRQDFLVAAPTAGAGELRVELALTGARAEATALGARLTFEGSKRALVYSHLRAQDATGRELPARLEVFSADRLAVSIVDANATYPVRIDPTFSDADWVSMDSGLPGANDQVRAIAVDSRDNVYVGGNFTLIGTVVANHVAKWDGSAWSALGGGIAGTEGTSPSVMALAVSGTNLYVGGGFTTAGGVAAKNIAQWDGKAWSALGSGVVGGSVSYVTALTVSGADLYVGGYFTTAGGVAATNIARWNGNAWSALGLGMKGNVSALALIGTDLYAGGKFTTAGAVTATNIAKWDGSSWAALGSALNGNSVNALAASGTTLYAGGDFNTAGTVAATNIAQWDGNAWSALGSGIAGSVNALAASGTDLYAGGVFTGAGGVTANYVAKWDGGSWSALGSGMGNSLGQPIVQALVVKGTNLYASGYFTAAGSVPANHIAKWDGDGWSALGSGMNSGVFALAVEGTNLYAGGHFTTAGGGAANYIAKWDGSAWSALGSGFNGNVLALAAQGTNLYAGGVFTTAGGVLATNIAKWDGSGWSALGSGLRNSANADLQYVEALALIGTDLYAGGRFDTAGGVLATNIAKWDGNAWSALGLGLGGSYYPEVNALAVSGTDLYAGGWFTTAGAVPARYIAKWDGSAWSALGSGAPTPVLALAVSGTSLYAGGWFTNWDGLMYVAKWDGSGWSILSGLGPNSPFPGSPRYVYALAASGTDLYVGGVFHTAGGASANDIAKWDGSTWWGLGSGMDGEVRALAADGAGHLFVGGYFTAAGTNVSCYIAQANLNGPPIPPGGVIQNIRLGAGTVTLDFRGRPGTLYDLQRATDVGFTQNLTTLLTTNPAPPDGGCCYLDTNPTGTAAFYRLRRQ